MITNPLKLTIELVPSSVWYSSIYQYYKKSNNIQKWFEIKKTIYEKEGYFCFICNAKTKHLEAHEFWKYDDKNHIQKLDAIHHLCGFCHKIKHIGLWLHTEDGEIMLRKVGLTKQNIINHFCKVNNCSEEVFKKHEEEAFKVWRERSNYEWKQVFGDYEPKPTKQSNNLTLMNFT